MPKYPARIALVIFILTCVALFFALFTQHVMGMQPCPWCIAQRVVLMLMAVVALLGSLVARASKPSLYTTAVLGTAGAGLALWQHFVAAKSASCALSLPDRWLSSSGLDQALPWLLEPKASCADAAVRLLGAPYEAWSFALFALLTGWALKVARN